MGDQNLLGGIAVLWGYSDIFALPPKRIMWGQLRIIQGGHLKVRGDCKKFKYEGAYKISWGV